MMKNELGLKDGKPLVGSVWSWDGTDRWRVSGPPSSSSRVPLVSVDSRVSSSAGLAAFQPPYEKGFALVSLPPEGELEWKPLDREMLRLEQRARTWEEKGQLLEAKGARKLAHALVEMDARIAAEESALKEHRYIAKALLKKLTPGDRACYEMKGLKEFKAHAAEAAEYLYWD